MTRVFLAAGVAALAISAPANAQGPHGGRAGQTTQVKQRGADRHAQRTAKTATTIRTARPARTERVNMAQSRASDRQQARASHAGPVHERRIARQPVRTERVQQAQTRVDRQQSRTDRQAQAQARHADRQMLRTDRQARVQTHQAERQMLRTDRHAQVQTDRLANQQLRTDRRLQAHNLKTERVQLRADNVARIKALAANRAPVVRTTTYGARVLPMTTAQSLVGVPLTTAATVATLSPLPNSVQYLYPDTPDYYYRYGDGYLYQVDRGSNLIAALLPLLGGGYMPGSYLPNIYMNSYAPDYYGLNSFYPASYGANYGYGYQNLCNRYANGVIYQVDCMTGMIESVVPLYASGYGVGQMLPSAYNYYNVPSQYRSMYYDTGNTGYWYAPGAIYQYDQRSSLITSVAALLSPGMTIGQPMPMGYSAYNVPYAYRTTYMDTPDAWYRYNNGYIYQVDPATQLVSAVVASILT